MSLLILTFALYRVRFFLRLYTLATALVSTVAFTLFLTGTYFRLGIGGMERLASYPVTIWLILFGVYISQSHFRKLRQAKKSALQQSVAMRHIRTINKRTIHCTSTIEAVSALRLG